MPRLAPPFGSIALLAAFSIACGSSKSDDDGDSTGSGESGDADDGSDSDAGGDSGGDDGSAGPGDDGGTGDGETSDGGGDVGDESARGIRIDLLEANQGVGIAIARNDVLVDRPQRNAPILADRNTLITGYYVLEPGFEHRDIRGVLTIEAPDMAPQSATSTVTTKDTPMGSWVYDDVFRWVIPGEMIQPGTKYSVELFETGPEHLGEPEQSPPPRIPETGTAELGVDQEDLKLRVTIVPLRYNHPSIGWIEPDTSTSAIETVSNLLYDQNPAIELDLQVRDMIDYPSRVQTGGEFGAILGFLSNLKSQDGASANVYYAGIIDTNCPIIGCTSSGTVGIANLTDPTQSDGNQRVSANMWNIPGNGAQTLVHEVGHNQGLRHIACPTGNSSGNDPSYPHPDGIINNAGFGVRGFTLNRPEDFDYMSYCGPPWASDWTWLKTAERISILTSWGDGYVDPAPNGEQVLLGHIDAEGVERWWVVDGGVDEAHTDPDLTFSFTDADGMTHEVAAAHDRLEDVDVRRIRVQLPRPIADLTGITRYEGSAAMPLDLAGLR